MKPVQPFSQSLHVDGRMDIYRISVRRSFVALHCDVPAELVTWVYREELLNLKLWPLNIIIGEDLT